MPARTLATQMLIIELNAVIAKMKSGELVVVKKSLADEATYALAFELAAPDLEREPEIVPSPAPAPTPAVALSRSVCPMCAGSAVVDGGKTPGAAPPTLDLLCITCQHVWQVPL